MNSTKNVYNNATDNDNEVTQRKYEKKITYVMKYVVFTTPK